MLCYVTDHQQAYVFAADSDQPAAIPLHSPTATPALGAIHCVMWRGVLCSTGASASLMITSCWPLFCSLWSVLLSDVSSLCFRFRSWCADSGGASLICLSSVNRMCLAWSSPQMWRISLSRWSLGPKRRVQTRTVTRCGDSCDLCGRAEFNFLRLELKHTEISLRRRFLCLQISTLRAPNGFVYLVLSGAKPTCVYGLFCFYVRFGVCRTLHVGVLCLLCTLATPASLPASCVPMALSLL